MIISQFCCFIFAMRSIGKMIQCAAAITAIRMRILFFFSSFINLCSTKLTKSQKKIHSNKSNRNTFFECDTIMSITRVWFFFMSINSNSNSNQKYTYAFLFYFVWVLNRMFDLKCYLNAFEIYEAKEHIFNQNKWHTSNAIEINLYVTYIFNNK